MENKRIILIEKVHKTTCLYFHINPIKQEIFYVGIGDKKRPYIKSKNQRTKFWHNTVKKYGYQIIIIEKNLTWDDACKKEIYWIKRIGRKDLGEGTLVNLTDGGNGLENPSRELRKKFSKSHIGKRLIDLMNKKFNKLTVVKRAKNGKNGQARWICNCECGTKDVEVYSNHLIDGHTKSCGCLYLESNNGKPILQLERKTGNTIGI